MDVPRTGAVFGQPGVTAPAVSAPKAAAVVPAPSASLPVEVTAATAAVATASVTVTVGPPPAAPTPLTRPGLVDDVHCTNLLKTLSGIALLYGGTVRRKSVLNVMACVVVICAVVSLLWFAGPDYVKDSGKVAVSHIAPNIPESAYAMFQLTFAIITAALVVGAFVERMRFAAVVIFMSLWTLLAYALIANWVWKPNGWLAELGVLDFADDSVVHINAGVAGLVYAFALGPRRGFGRETFAPFNLGLTMAGAGMLWVGWFDFNAGSALASDGRAGLAMAATHIAAAAGALSWMLDRASMPLATGLVLRPSRGAGRHLTSRRVCHSPFNTCYWAGCGSRVLLGRNQLEKRAKNRRLSGCIRRAWHRRDCRLTADGRVRWQSNSGVESSVWLQAIGLVRLRSKAFS